MYLSSELFGFSVTSAVRQLNVVKSDSRGGINRKAVASFSPTLPLRLRWEWNEIGLVNRNAVAPVLKAGVFNLRLYAARAQPFQGWGNRRLLVPR